MSAIQALKAASDAGIRIGIDGDALVLEAGIAPPPGMLDLLAQHKAGIVALLRSANDGWSREDWLAFFDERAGIAEFDGGLSRQQAEARAFACCVLEWLNSNPVGSPPCGCLVCGESERAQDKLLPFGAEQAGHAWLHSRCWEARHASRKSVAVAALSTLGIRVRTSP
jgi:hypothetical protein